MAAGKKTLVGIALLLVSVLAVVVVYEGGGGGREGVRAADRETVVPPGAVHMALTVGGLDCDGCERDVEERLLEIDGVYRADARSGERVVKIWYDPGRVDVTTMRAAMIEGGYSPAE